MGYINKVRKTLAELEAYWIQYAVIQPAREYNEKYNYLALQLNTGVYFADNKIRKEIQEQISTMDTIFNVHIAANGDILVDNTRISPKKFSDFFYKAIGKTPDYCIKYQISNSSTFAEYIFIVDGIMQAVYQLRQEYANSVYQQDFDMMDDDEQGEIRKIIPFRILEMPEWWFD